jgi:protein-tyrosine phosphatase
MTRSRNLFLAACAGFLLPQPLAAQALEAPAVDRIAPDRIVVRWSGDDPVDVYVAARPDVAGGKARLLVRADRDGRYAFERTDPARPYFILKDERDGSVARVAERLLPLERGSNFRDVGGYPAAGGKHVRWGMIYRTAATPMLTDADYRYVEGLKITADIDLRSVEERQVAPDTLPARTGARYFANDYPSSDIFPKMAGKTPQASQAALLELYRTWPTSLAPQFRALFQQLLRRDGAVSYHCSAGQDRTGVATALVLSALGVPRDVILADYQLSTAERRPENEMPKLDPDRYPGNPVAALYVKAQSSGVVRKPQPLYDDRGVAFLQQTFDEIDARWGSVDNYLGAVLGVDRTDIARLRAIYLE